MRKIHPTYDESIRMINQIEKSRVHECLTCVTGDGWSCFDCIIGVSLGKMDRCTTLKKDEKLSGLAFILTMPKDIKRSLMGSDRENVKGTLYGVKYGG